jgi:flagellum-specific peptidoglycan hydrolase FlgJ
MKNSTLYYGASAHTGSTKKPKIWLHWALLVIILIYSLKNYPFSTAENSKEQDKPENMDRASFMPGLGRNEEVSVIKPSSLLPAAEGVTVREEKKGETEQYIERFKKVALKEEEKFGIPACITLAQGILESNTGASRLVQEANNHFGIKCFSRHCKKGHCINFSDDSHKDFFLVFPTAWESYRAHSKLLSQGRYKQLKKIGREDYISWAEGLYNAGYATDKKYAEKLIAVIVRYKLNEIGTKSAD